MKHKIIVLQLIIMIGLILISYSMLFLRTTITTRVEKYDEIMLPGNTYVSIPVYLNTNDSVMFNYSMIPSESSLIIILSDSSVLNLGDNIFNMTDFIGMNYTYRGSPGLYYLLLINNAEHNVTLKYSLYIYKQRITEKYHGSVSIIGSSLILFGIISIFYLKMKELTQKYPDHVYSSSIECWSTKLYKHRCNILLPSIDPELLEIVGKTLENMGYRQKSRLSETIVVYEKKLGLLERFRRKPAEVLITIEEPYLSLYYEVWPIVASGSKDLTWILKEAETIRDSLYSGINKKNNSSESI